MATKRDFEALRHALKTFMPNLALAQRRQLLNRIAGALASTNPRFDFDKFVEEAGGEWLK